MKRTDPLRSLAAGLLTFVIWGIVPVGPGGRAVWAQATSKQEEESVKVIATRRSTRPPVQVKAQPPAPLATAEKVRRVKAIMASMREQDLKDRSLGLSQRFPLGLVSQANLTLAKLHAENRMTPRHPYLGTTASLNFARPSYVSGYSNNSYFPQAAFASGVHLTTQLEITAGKTYLLDYAIGLNPPPPRVIVVQPDVTIDLQMAVVNGHLLVPFTATVSGNCTIFVSPEAAPFEFYSVEINTIE